MTETKSEASKKRATTRATKATKAKVDSTVHTMDAAAKCASSAKKESRRATGKAAATAGCFQESYHTQFNKSMDEMMQWTEAFLQCKTMPDFMDLYQRMSEAQMQAFQAHSLQWMETMMKQSSALYDAGTGQSHSKKGGYGT